MIYTVTFNPALDYVVKMPSFAPLTLNRTHSEEIQYGGKGINVSVMLQRLGVESVALGFLAGFTGKELEALLQQEGIGTDFIWLEEGNTRINVKIKAGPEEQEETEINARGPEIGETALDALWQRLLRLEKGDMLVLSGSMPASLPQQRLLSLLKELGERGVELCLDTSGELLRQALSCHPFLIKPNHVELGELFGRELIQEEDIRECAAALQKLGARNVLVSMAGEGSLLLEETGACHRMKAPKGRVKNSVGAGDSMLAGFLAGWLQTGDAGYAHRLGTASGSATAFEDGLAERKAIDDLLMQL